MLHIILEVQKPHDLLSASWGPRGVAGANLFGSEGLRARAGEGVCRSLRAGEDDEMSQLMGAGRKGRLPPPSIFCSVQVLSRLGDAHPVSPH